MLTVHAQATQPPIANTDSSILAAIHPLALEAWRYEQLGQYEKAITKYEQLRPNVLSQNRGIITFQLAKAYYQLGHYKSATTFAQQALPQLQQATGQMKALALLSNSYWQQQQLTQATTVANEWLLLAQQMRNVSETNAAYLQLGSLAITKHQYNQAIQLAENAYQASATTEQQLQAATILHKSYEALQNKPASYHWLRIKDSIATILLHVKAEQEKLLQQSIYKAQYQQKTLQNMHMNNAEQQTTITTAVVVTLLLFGFIIMYDRSNKRQKKANAQLAKTNAAIAEKNKEIAQQKEYLQQINNVKDRMFSIIGHDLRAPLVSLQSVLNLWDQKIIAPEHAMELLPKLRRQVHGANLLVENLNTWAKLQMQGGVSNAITSVPIYEVVDEVLFIYTPLAQEKNIRLTANVHAAACVVADRNYLSLILRNLVNNAIKFTPSGGSVTITSIDEASKIRLTVNDSGLGMAAEDVAKINHSESFTRFGTDNERGSGLGLQLIKQYLQAFGTDLEVSSELGEGSTFSFLLTPCPKLTNI
ncbi:MAG: ATP-binding protein [Chitinophagaceae bacterium]